MFEIYLKDSGKIFTKNNGKVVRTPIKFYIEDSEKTLYESLIRASSILDYEINPSDIVNTNKSGIKLFKA